MPDYHGEDDWKSVYAAAAVSAAEKYAERYDEGDYTLLNGHTVTMLVRKDEDSEVTTFEVSGETVPRYHAHEK